ncbi:MAG: ABC transporter permease [Burkholderiales bacterium]
MFARVIRIVIKEFLQLRRDKWARFRLIVPSIVQMLIFGYAATFEVFDVSTAVLDLDQTQESRDLISRFTHSSRFRVVAIARTQREINAAINESEATVALVVHAGFASLLRKGESAPLQVIVDGTNSNTALISLGYVNQIASRFSQEYATDLFARTRAGQAVKPVQVKVEQRPQYNQELNSRWFFVPGVMGTLTLIIVVGITAFAIVREREMGTLEQIMVTPVRPVEFILGKTLPSLVIGFAEVGLVSMVGVLWFRIPFVGNPLVLVAGTGLFLFSTIALGLLISTVCMTQQQAFATQFFVVNPLFTLSGFSFPIASMPPFLQWLTYLDPLRYYLVVIRGTFLKGVGMNVLWPEFLAMAVLAGALLTISVARFRKSLD